MTSTELLTVPKYFVQSLAHSLRVTASPVHPTTVPTLMKLMMRLPDVLGHLLPYLFPVYRLEDRIALEAAAEESMVQYGQTQSSHNLSELPFGVVGFDHEYFALLVPPHCSAVPRQ